MVDISPPTKETLVVFVAVCTYTVLLVHKREYLFNIWILWGIGIIVWTSALLVMYTGAWLAAWLVCSLGLCDRAALAEWGSAGFWQAIYDFMSGYYAVQLYCAGTYWAGRIVDAARPFFDVAMHEWQELAARRRAKAAVALRRLEQEARVPAVIRFRPVAAPGRQPTPQGAPAPQAATAAASTSSAAPARAAVQPDPTGPLDAPFELEVNSGDATPAEIRAIVTGIVGRPSGQERPEGLALGLAPRSLECAICLDLMTNPCSTPCCGASFCRACLQEHLDKKQAIGARKECPWCNKDMPSAPAVNRILRAICVDEAEARARGVDPDSEALAIAA